MRRLFITTTILIGVSAAGVAAPTFDGRVLWSGSTATDAELAPVLEGWVRETVEDAKREADAMSAIAREHGIPVAPVRHEIQHVVHFRSPEIVSVLREDWAYEGGANGTLWLIPVNWDARADALIPIQSVLGAPEESETAYQRVSALLREATVEQVWDGQPGDWGVAIEAAVRPDPMYLSTFTFVPSTVPDRIGGIAWHFEPYMVAPGSEGAVSVVIPQDELRDVVAPEWRELFAGEPAGSLNARLVSPADEKLTAILASF